MYTFEYRVPKHILQKEDKKEDLYLEKPNKHIRRPDELWTEVHDIVQETGIKTIPKKNKCRKAKWLTEKAMQMADKRREVKNKGKKERCTHQNAEFQRMTRRDKKALMISEKKWRKTTKWERLEISENQRYQGNISCKNGHNKGQKLYGPNRSRRY